jgi:hypothetical protein
MPRASRRFPRFLLLLCTFLLGAFVLAPAAHADLPGGVASRVKKIEQSLGQADVALENGRLQTAQRKLKDTERPFKEITDRYGGKFDEDDPVYKAMLEHLAKTREAIAAAEKEAEDSAGAEAAAKAAHEARCQEWVDKLGPFTDRNSELYLRVGAELNRATPEEQAACKAAYAKAKALFAEYQKVEFSAQKTMELRNIESSLTSTMKYYAADESDAAQEEACKEWVDLLAPYVDVGMNSDRYLIAAPTMNTAQIARQQELYEDAKAVFALYRKAEFPLGKSWRLQTLEEAMARTLEEFPAAMAESQAMLSGDVGTRLDQVLQHMERDVAWKQDETTKPHVVMERDLEPLREAVERYAGTVDAGDATLAELRGKLAAIEERNAEYRAVRAQRTFQTAEGYTGADLESLRELADKTAVEAHPGAEVALVTVRSTDWVVEDVVEWTDTSRTALRRRITRSVRAEVGLTDADGKAWLQEVYLGQDRLPDGGWGPLKAHTTWADAMAPANLGKTAPAAG